MHHSLNRNPCSHELTEEFCCRGCMWHEFLAKQVFEHEIGEFRVNLDFITLNSETIPLVVKFVSQAVVPLNRAKINPIELIRSVLLPSVGQRWGAFSNV